MGGKVQMIFEGDDAKLVQSLDKQTAKLKKLEAEFDALKRKGQDAGKAGSDSADKMSKAFGALGAATGPLAAVGVMFSSIKKLIEDVNAEADRAAETAKGTFGTLQKLSQISGGSPAEFKSLVEDSMRISREQGIPFEASGMAMFSGRSLSLTREEVNSLAPFARVADLQPIVEGVGDTMAAFGRGEAGSALSIANKTGVAAGVSKVSIAEFAPHLATIGKPAQMIGVGDEEAMASLAYLAAGQGRGPEEGATQIKNLMTSIRNSPKELGIRGMGSFAEMVKGINALPEDVRAKYFESNIRSAGGLAGMTEKLPKIEALTERLRREENVLAGTDGSYLRGTIRAFESTDLSRGLIRSRRTANARKLDEMEAVGTGRLGTASVLDELASESINRGEGRYVRAMRQRQASMVEGFLPSEGAIRAADASAGGSIFNLLGPGGVIGGLVVSINDLVEELKGNRAAPVEDRRTQIFYGSPNEGAQMRSPAGRRDPSTGR